ncbi:MAG: methyltransferase domain-containing protein [Flavobacteriales bacterium]|nr:methyltransferase domain-containing protein [Flavobacteriales bacterium]
MAYNYDSVYRNPQYFGEPIEEIISFYREQKDRGKLLDIGAGQGRDAIPLALMGYRVTAIDTSPTGIRALKTSAIQNGVEIETRLEGVDSFNRFHRFDFIHLNSLFYFRAEDDAHPDGERLKRIFDLAGSGAIFLVGFSNADGRDEKLRNVLAELPKAEILLRRYIDTSATERVSGLRIPSEFHFTVFCKG